MTSVASSPAIPQGDKGFTEWQVSQPLRSGDTYYWRSRADAYAYSEVRSFTVNAKVYAYPNPVRFNADEYVTFALPDEPVDLMVQTISGETVVVQSAIAGEWHLGAVSYTGDVGLMGLTLVDVDNR